MAKAHKSICDIKTNVYCPQLLSHFQLIFLRNTIYFEFFVSVQRNKIDLLFLI